MKIPKTLMQEILALRADFEYEDFVKWTSDIIERRRKPFTPEILKDYGFVKWDKSHNTYIMNIKGKDLFLTLDEFENNFQYEDNGFYCELNLTFPIWKTIDDFENDLSRVIEAIG